VLSEGGWRVLEYARNNEQRLDPLGSQSRNFTKLNNGSRSSDERRRPRMVVVSGCDESNRARVIGPVSVRVNAFVQLRRDAQRERPKKSANNENRSEITRPIRWTRNRAHCDASLRPLQNLRKRFLRNLASVKRYQMKGSHG
jgi:hypothetical protein